MGSHKGEDGIEESFVDAQELAKGFNQERDREHREELQAERERLIAELGVLEEKERKNILTEEERECLEEIRARIEELEKEIAHL